MNVITSIVVVVGLYLFIWKQRIGDLIVWILETVFDMKHEAAFYYYSDHFRGNKEIFFAVAVLLIFTVLMVRIFRWVTGYFREVNQGIESLLADDEKQIQLSPEMMPFERKLNSVKQTLAERKMETALGPSMLPHASFPITPLEPSPDVGSIVFDVIRYPRHN